MRRLLPCIGIATYVMCGVTPALAGVDSQVVPGWAGYAVRAAADSFASVHGRWVEPHVICNRPGSAAAFWVGLGGTTRHSRALEQVGTSAECSSRAELSYSTWYQLWPARAVELPVAVRPEEVVDAAVAVNGATVSIALRNMSTGVAVTKDIVMWEPETDSAEWIVEAPAMCFVTCTLAPLATFGRVTFTETTATLGAHAGTISDSRWTASRFTMGVRKRRTVAAASLLLGDGSSFAVTRSRD